MLKEDFEYIKSLNQEYKDLSWEEFVREGKEKDFIRYAEELLTERYTYLMTTGLESMPRIDYLKIERIYQRHYEVAAPARSIYFGAGTPQVEPEEAYFESEATRTAVFGYRIWRVPEPQIKGKNELLRSIWSWTLSEEIGYWYPGINRAKCFRDQNHAVPAYYHECGFNAFNDIDRAKSYRNTSGYNTVLGTIAGAGRVQLHKTGFRAEQAQILGFLAGDNEKVDPEVVESLAQSYRVPVFYDEKKLIADLAKKQK